MRVLIGPQWLAIADTQGRRRLDNPQDWIRQEIVTALERDVRVVAVLLEGARIPEPPSLSPNLQGLTRRQALDMSDSRWRGDLQRLVEALEKIPGLTRPASPDAEVDRPTPVQPPAPTRSGRKQLFLGIGLGVLGLLALAVMLDEGEDTAAFVPPPLPTVLPAQAMAPGAPDVTGMWRTATGEVYHFEQDGAQVRFTAEAGGQHLGQGQGQFDGALLRLAMTLQGQGAPVMSTSCDMQPAPDGRSFSGICTGPNGAFPAQFFR